ncbi:MAG TPA: acetate--CoA ligase family protein [Longimicrobiales bacterium]|nr:acetate--CoA ligase family protein [Longimicrobiales bacterium]
MVPGHYPIRTGESQSMPSLDAFFQPRSIAVVGASRRSNTIGYQIVDNLLRHGYTGVIYPVNPNAAAVHSIAAYPSVGDIPGAVDLAVIVVPKDGVLEVVEQCGAKGVKALVVISAGFKEVGGAGVAMEATLAERVRALGMRLVGPNCMGILSTDPAFSMNATFAPTMPPAGPMSFLSQSGAMGVTILDYAAEYGIGIHHFASVGNKADVSGNDLVEYWGDDPGTKVILMYLENFGNPQRFTSLARKVTRTKPIVVVKSGRTQSGARAAASHTGALAGVDVATDALLSQCGVLRADSVEALFDMAMALEEQPIPRGSRVAIVTNAGGPGIMIADACESEGLDVVELSADTQARLRDIFPAEASVRNPVDMIASATSESYRVALEAVLADPNVDAAIAAFVPPLGVRQVDVASSIVEAFRQRKERDKPILAVLMGRQGLPEGRAELNESGIPAYMFPESAALALAAMVRYRQWLERPVQEPTRFEVDDEAVRRILEGVRVDGRQHLKEHEALDLLGACGVPVVEHRMASTHAEAREAAEWCGYPVVLKAVAPDVVHKTDVGAVRVDIRSVQELDAAYGDMIRRMGEAHIELEGILVEKFVQGGRETIIGMSIDPSFGPILMFGLGGIYVEVLQDVAFRLAPVSEIDASEMLDSIRGARLLEEFRGTAGVDRSSVTEAIQRISQLVVDHPEIAELDINPFLAFPEGGVAVDCRVALHPKADR